VLDVPAKLAARVRVYSRGHGRKTDKHDAVSVGLAALDGTGVLPVAGDDALVSLRLLCDRREELTAQRTQAVCRLNARRQHRWCEEDAPPMSGGPGHQQRGPSREDQPPEFRAASPGSSAHLCPSPSSTTTRLRAKSSARCKQARRHSCRTGVPSATCH